MSSVLRSRWPCCSPDRPELIPSAYALDSVLIELIFVTGPLLTTVTVATVGPQYALAVSAACVLRRRFMLLAGLHGHERPAAPEAGSRRFGLGALAAPGLRTLVLASLPVGFAFGTIEVVLPAFSAEEGHRELAGVLLAVWAGASGVGGLVYGARPPRSPLRRPPPARVRAADSDGAATARHVAAHHGAARGDHGPADRAVDRLAEPARRASRAAGTATEAFTWPLTALVAGLSLGAAAGGALVESYSWTAAVVAAVAVSAAGAALLVARRDTLAPSSVAA